MPKLNVKQNNSNVIKAFQVALETGHRNLLDNPWFTVNQRKITSLTVGTEKTYTLDRWYAFRARITALSGGGITFAWNGTDSTSGLLAQGSAYDLRGKTVTMSAIINGKVFSWTAPFTGTSISYTFSGLNIRFQLAQAESNTYAQIFIMTTTPVTIRAVKLELGSYSTLANDVPPDYGEELRKCRRFFRRYAQNQTGLAFIGRAGSATEAYFILGDEPMAKSTGITAAINGTVYARAGDNTNHSVTSAAVRTSIGGGPALICTTTGLTLGATAVIVFASGYIDINGDL